MTDIVLTAGTTRNLAIAIENNARPPGPIDLTTITDIAWLVLDSGRGVIQKTKLTGGILVVPPANAGNILVSMLADDTSPAFGVGSTTEVQTYTHEARLFYSDGTQEVVVTGSLTVEPTGSWKGEVAWTSGADRVVYVQGRY